MDDLTSSKNGLDRIDLEYISNIAAIRDNPYLTSKAYSLELIGLSMKLHHI
jgi:hypothetical protein